MCLLYDRSAEGLPKVVLWRSQELNLRPLVYKKYVYPLHHGGFTKTFCGFFPWVVTSTGLGGFMIRMFII